MYMPITGVIILLLKKGSALSYLGGFNMYFFRRLFLTLLFLFFIISSITAEDCIKLFHNPDHIDIEFFYDEASAKSYTDPDGFVLPLFSLALAVPPSESYRISALEHDFIYTDNSFTKHENDEEASANAPDPRVFVDPVIADIVFSTTGIIRYQQVLILNIRPAVLSGSTVKLYNYLKLRVSFESIRHHLMESSFRINNYSLMWEDTLLKMLDNYEHGKQWRIKKKPAGVGTTPAFLRDDLSPVIKFTVSADNIYIIKPKMFYYLGIDPTGIDPRTFQMYYMGEEIPIIVMGEEDGVFDITSDYILFYGKSVPRGEFHRNILTDKSAYFLVYNRDDGIRYTPYNSSPEDTPNALAFNTSFVQEKNLFHDIYNIYTANPMADNFFWKRIDAPSSKIFPFGLNYISHNGLDLVFKLYVSGVTALDVYPDHHFIVSLNNNVILDAEFDGRTSHLYTVSFPDSYLQNGLNILSVHVPGDTVPNNVDAIYLDWFQIGYNSQYVMSKGSMKFSRPKISSSPFPYTFKIDNVNNTDVMLIDTRNYMWFTDFDFEYNVESGRYSMFFKDDIEHQGDGSSPPLKPSYFLTLKKLIKRPDTAEITAVPDLLSTENRADLLVIYHKNFQSAVDMMSAFYESRGFEIYTVRIDHIYDAFNNGIVSIPCIRDFLEGVFNTWEKVPSHVTLFGGSTYDPMHFLEDSFKELFIPAWGEPANDFYYGCVSGEDDLLDYYISRIPAQAPEEALAYVQKVIDYTTNPFQGSWQKMALFINGGFNSSEQTIFEYQTENIVNDIICPNTSKDDKDICNTYKVSKTTTGCNWDEYKDEINQYLESGVAVVNFFGHAGSMTWDCMYSTDSVMGLSNIPRLPVILSNTCFTAAFDNPSIYSLSEIFTSAQPFGGSLVFVGQPLLGYMWGGYYLAREYFTSFYENRESNIGKAITEGKLRFYIDNYPTYVGTYQMSNLLGDGFAHIRLTFR